MFLVTVLFELRLAPAGRFIVSLIHGVIKVNIMNSRATRADVAIVEDPRDKTIAQLREFDGATVNPTEPRVKPPRYPYSTQNIRP